MRDPGATVLLVRLPPRYPRFTRVSAGGAINRETRGLSRREERAEPSRRGEKVDSVEGQWAVGRPRVLDAKEHII